MTGWESIPGSDLISAKRQQLPSKLILFGDKSDTILISQTVGRRLFIPSHRVNTAVLEVKLAEL
jgi:hypothetical protein